MPSTIPAIPIAARRSSGLSSSSPTSPSRAAIEGHRMSVHAPLIDLSKADIIRRGLALGVDYSLTVSCYQPARDGRPCGRCESCRLRRQGFEAAGVPDPAVVP
jgi:7-cyano-7-deazaguanine synthase